jgi:hypothetical protein
MRSRRHILRLSFAALLVSAARSVFTLAEPPDQPSVSSAEPMPAPTPSASSGQGAAPVTPRAARRALLPLTLAGAKPIEAAVVPAPSQGDQEVYLPLLQASAPPLIGAPLLGAPSGSAEQAIAWLSSRSVYSNYDITQIVNIYQRIGDSVGLDWFLALAQMAHETASMSSWWSQRPRRNPAGIGVTGDWRAGLPDGSPGPAPGPAWAWNSTLGRWLEGVSFANWGNGAVPAHLGRLLAYALPADQGDATRQALIDQALGFRALPASHRGSAPTILGLNGRWAVPGTDYGQRIMLLAEAMRRL